MTERERQLRETSIATVMVRNAKGRAKRAGVPFSLTPEDVVIPDLCPVLGIPIKQGKGGHSANSPTLDKIIPALGYVPGNVAVISHRANALKNNASIHELRALVRYIEKHTQNPRRNTHWLYPDRVPVPVPRRVERHLPRSPLRPHQLRHRSCSHPGRDRRCTRHGPPDPARVSRYHHAVIPQDSGFAYRIYEGTRVVTTSGTFHNRRDADAVGAHFASDDDLEAHRK
jgi:hypothetical protein